MKKTIIIFICLVSLLAACSSVSDEDRDAAIGAASAGLAESGADIYRIGGYTYVPLEILKYALGIDFSIHDFTGDRVIDLDLGPEIEADGAVNFFLGPDLEIDLFRGTGGAFLMFDGEYFFQHDSPGAVSGPSLRDNRGNTHVRYLALFSRTEQPRLEISLDERFNLFSFTLALPERYANDRDALLLNIFGDGRPLYTAEVTFGHRTANVLLDVTNVSRLRITYESVYYGTVYGVILGNPTFIIDQRGDVR